jgi:uroporphyrinogen III methyltransferase/synthase
MHISMPLALLDDRAIRGSLPPARKPRAARGNTAAGSPAEEGASRRYSAAMSASAIRPVAVTRPKGQADGLMAALGARGIVAAHFPLIRVEPAAALVTRAAFMFTLKPRDWLVFTSANAVRQFLAPGRVGGGETDAPMPPVPAGAKLACIGEATARELTKMCRAPDLVAPGPDSESLASALIDTGIAGSGVLWPHGDLADTGFSDALAGAGARVVKFVVHRTVADTAGAASLAGAIGNGAVAAVTLASPSALHALLSAVPNAAVLASLPVVTIGRRTTAECRERGISVAAEAAAQSDEGIADAVAMVLRRAGSEPPAC